ncbi:MAG TPA: N-methyl-L-tryptophan oxidase [Candidatus Limnocylindrales bacterium]|nr:N-methyl-L-tryptophan oxidase [Candidatus Limnocylindrales bacterium]
MHYEAIVVGLGAMGSASAAELARRGVRVLGIEAFGRAHDLGSSGGLSRIIRLAYFEHPSYVPLLRDAWQGWRSLEQETGRQLLLQTGGLYAGRRGSAVLEGALRSAIEHDIGHRLLEADQAAADFPALRLETDMVVLHEHMAGLLYPERCIETHLAVAAANGAELHFGERVLSWGGADVLELRTDAGSYTCDRLVIAAGAWLPRLAPELELPLVIERNVLFWFDPVEPTVLQPERLPVYIIELDEDHAFYGFPLLPDQGAKVARHHGGRPTDPDTIERAVSPEDERPVRAFTERFIPAAAGRLLDAKVCMYTNTPDFDFIIDTHPADERVVIASPCSGHGFKFSNVMGRIAADLALHGGTAYDIRFLAVDRFARV